MTTPIIEDLDAAREFSKSEERSSPHHPRSFIFGHATAREKYQARDKQVKALLKDLERKGCDGGAIDGPPCGWCPSCRAHALLKER